MRVGKWQTVVGIVLLSMALASLGSGCAPGQPPQAQPDFEYSLPAGQGTLVELGVSAWQVHNEAKSMVINGVDSAGHHVGGFRIDVDPENERWAVTVSTGVRLVFQQGQLIAGPVELDEMTALWLAAAKIDNVAEGAEQEHVQYTFGPEDIPPAPDSGSAVADAGPPSDPLADAGVMPDPSTTTPDAGAMSDPLIPDAGSPEPVEPEPTPEPMPPATDNPPVPGWVCIDRGAQIRTCFQAAWDCTAGWGYGAVVGAFRRLLGSAGRAASGAANIYDNLGCVSSGAECTRVSMGRECTMADFTA